MATTENQWMVKPDLQEMMKVFKELGTPGAPHENLAKMVGKWKTNVKSWTDLDKPPTETVGRSVGKMILDGRFLQQEETGTMMGMPFRGIAITGYDNYAKKYTTFWLDSLSTALYYFEGIESADGTLTMQSRYVDPFKGPMTYRSVTKFIDDNTYTFDMYATDRSGVKTTMMKVTYMRE
ncbi:MAG: DUF1579 domain-containing protein [Endomicrobiales bacterium]